jgi:hypothetical protein
MNFLNFKFSATTNQKCSNEQNIKMKNHKSEKTENSAKNNSPEKDGSKSVKSLLNFKFLTSRRHLVKKLYEYAAEQFHNLITLDHF